MKKKRTYVTNAEISKKIGWPGWAIFGIILAGVFFILGTFYGPDWYDNFHNKEGIVTSPSEIEYLCPHKTMKKSISLTNYEDSPIEDYSLAFSWPIEENVTVEIDYVENFQKKKILR